MAEAKRDNNRVPTLLGTSNADGVTPVAVYADPTTHRLLVSASTGTLSGLSDVTLTSTAQGDILYHNGTDWVNLAAGTTGKFLKTQGAGANPIWDTPSAGAGDMVLASEQTITGAKTFGSAGAVGKLKIAGTTSGSTILDATAAASGTLTLPAATDTLVGKATTDTFTNKTYDTAGAGNSFSINSVAVTANTGTGAVARETSPVFVTPTLGVAGATSIATSAATPLLLTNGQLVNVALTSQTVGATTLTIPDFAGVVDEFTFKTMAQTLSNKTFVAPALGAATATSINGITLTSQAIGFTVAGGTTSKTLTVPLDASVAGTNTGDQTDVSGNAGTVTVAAETSDTSCSVLFATDVSGSLAPKTNTNLTFNASTGVLTSASAVLTTADINGGTADNVVIGGSTAAAVTGTTITANTGIVPDADDGAYLGQAGTAFSDLFLAEGGVINWDSGDATLTQTGNVVVLAGATLETSTVGTAANSVATIDGTQTLTNKRVTKRTGTTTSSATPTINTDNVDFYSLTAQTEAITSFTTNLSGTPTENQTLWIAITGTAARAITWGTSFEASTVALPTTTVSTNRLDVGFVWNTVTSKWRCVASA